MAAHMTERCHRTIAQQLGNVSKLARSDQNFKLKTRISMFILSTEH
jgi:hypothetical protein